MMAPKSVKLPSGATLKIQPAPFADAKALWMSLLEEGSGLRLDPQAEVDANFFKNVFCVGFSSRKIEAAVWKCLDRCLYNDLKITQDTFEDIKAREDYLTILFEVSEENVRPFTKSLSAGFSRVIQMIQSVPA